MPSDAPRRAAVFDRRRSGLLLPLSALHDDVAPALGAPARRAVEWMSEAGFSVWQVLPLGPLGAEGSPYWTRSDFASEARYASGLAGNAEAGAFERWRRRESGWLDDFALFEALAHEHDGAPWTRWPAAERDRDPAALAEARARHARTIESVCRAQFAFDGAWAALRDFAHERGVRFFGDLPIYVAPHSAETWVHRGSFQLDAHGEPVLVAGVPPDYFAADGQLWGNPLYDWEAEARAGFPLWRARIRRALDRYDLVRLDHFRAIAGYWAVPVGATTARAGTWRTGPGDALLAALREEAPDAPFVAEDLGEITPDVVALRERAGLPGMRVLQFAFDGDPANVHLPWRHERRAVVYTGTHDNDTTHGWCRGLDAGTLNLVRCILDPPPGRMQEALVRATLGSVADLAVLPVADVLGLGSEARLNTPGTVGRNWAWRLPADALTNDLARRWSMLNRTFGRALPR
jgi:4-alpha-glucanotransferase